MTTKRISLLNFKKLQKFSSALMLPIAILPAAGLILAIGTSFNIELLANCGGLVFQNLPLLFCVGIVIGLTGDGSSSLSAITSYMILNATMGTRLGITADSVVASKGAYANVLGIPTLQTGVFGGLLVSIFVYLLYKRFHNIELPQFLGFFGGKRFVPIITAAAAIAVGWVLPYVWIPVQHGLSALSSLVTNGHNANFAAFIYAVGERSLIPFGLHHIWNVPFYYNFGEYVTKGGQLVTGDIPVFFAQLRDGAPLTAGLFMSGRFPIMMFGLPAAALAMYQEARPERRKMIKGLLLSAALTSFVTGITEPLEYAFLFVAPVLYIIHIFVYASSFVLMNMLNVHIGHPFAGGLIDFVLNGVLPNRTPWYLVIVAGAGYAAIYYTFFRVLIRKFNLKTPGREEEEVIMAAPMSRSERPYAIVSAIGGFENIEDVDACATRLRLALIDDSKVDDKRLKALGASGLVKLGDGGVQVIFGGKSQILRDEIKDAMRAPRKEPAADNHLASAK
ncbi:glucose-specific PTS transporter subunit IIBC [Serratia ficaria]|uniref:glucose-specific PTS transporter subunit IIBC n=1 Tax=Serratia ficaria TaxID=61651 RepID=UPI0021790393|nr:glucose-specific PTS transporter subunit IIBC [Serratia ficaria]CAI0797485.1 EIICBA-Glc [Serratia ficaria]CAI1662796.1 EIICBA-Glc [Serratia ficaria]